MENKPNKIIVHHDGVTREGDSFDAINQAHLERGFPLSSLGFHVGYQYLIEKSGAIRQAREDLEEGAHTVGENTSSIGICLAGNFDVEFPTDAQIDSLGLLLANLVKAHGIDGEQIFPHRKYAEKSCYGSRLADDWGVWVRKFYQSKLVLAGAQDICDTTRKAVYTAKE